MGPKPETLWNDVAAPTNCGTYTADQATEVNGSKGSKGSGYVASQSVSSVTGKNYEDKQGTYTSDQSTQTVGNGNVKKLSSTTPNVEDVGYVASTWGGKGVGGY